MSLILKDKFLKIIIVIILLLNLVLLARILGDIYLPGEVTALERAKQGAQAVIDYSEDLANSYGVGDTKNVKNILAKFKYEIEKSDNAEEVASLMVDYGRQVQDIIFREVQNKRINKVLNIVNGQELPKEGSITISDIDGNIKIVDPGQILNKKTKEELNSITLKQTIELKIKERRARILTPGDIFNQVEFLQTKVASLERRLNTIKQRAGFAQLNGSGLVIRVYDKSDNTEETGIVHSTDIRNIIDELLIAGAKGVEIGGQRLTATTPIRCVGPTILVNNKPIPVDPITIKVVGKPDVLKSSLNIIHKQLKTFGIKLEMKVKENVVLNGT